MIGGQGTAGNALRVGHRAHATNVPVGYKRTEVGVIPEDWEVRTLGALGDFKNGINKGKQDFGHGFPFVNLMDVFGVPKVSTDSSFGLVNSSLGEQEAYALQSGDVLFVRSSVKPEGVGLTILIPEDLPNTVFSGFLIRYRDNGVFALEFKEHCFWEASFRNRLIASSTVSANTNINQEALKFLQLAFPPNKAEQRAIAEALSDVDRLLETLEALIAKKRAIKQAAMQQLLTGKTRLPGFSGEWELGNLADFGVFRSGNGFPLVFQGHQSGDYPFFKVSDINNRGNELFMKSANHWISEDVRRTLGATKFPVGSVVFAKIGAAVFLERKRLLSQESCLDNNMMAFSLTAPGACERFFYYLFFRIELGKLVSTTALPSLSSREIGAICVSLPPLDEQRAIAAILSDMDADIVALERRRDKTRAIKQGMMQQLLTGRVRLVEPDLDLTKR